ncbi:uncharacterized protein LOC104907476 [Beta vulgaris subsp. vulgaris]|uniref:uncharacterized protein LOC104907476 n=1 Tax=Beta vulgaris subsp. vulgaris TaxID=3555 RepID=UPI002548B0F5|nr:uncharacterized protein LOC104907476 [Beta vulgaris subsp. vulgaris]
MDFNCLYTVYSTGKVKHYGFIEFKYPEVISLPMLKVAKIVADCMHNYLLLEHMLQVQLIPAERVHPKLWKGVNRRQKVSVDFVQIERLKHNKDRSLEEQRKMLKSILKRDKKRRSKIQAAGIDYECPEIFLCDLVYDALVTLIMGWIICY